MRIGLITIGEPAEAGEAGLVAGRTLAHHQLDFALAQGCGKIVALSHGPSEESAELRHAAEAGGAQFQLAHGVRDLPATVRADDQLLVLAQGLLPDSNVAFEQLHEGHGLLVLPAEAGWSAGFERLDMASAWGGAMVLPGRLAAGLDELPDDAEPIAALLRLGRQAGLPEHPLPERELTEGRWQIVRTADAARACEPAWLRRRLPSASRFRPTAWLARTVVRKFGADWSADGRIVLGVTAAAVLLLAGALAAGWLGLSTLAFALLVPAATAIEGGEAIRSIGKSIFGSERMRSTPFFVLYLMWDLVFVALGIMTIDGSRAHRLFAPVVATGMLHVPPPAPEAGWLALTGDRGLLAALLATAAAFGWAEGGFMALALLLIGLRIAVPALKRG